MSTSAALETERALQSCVGDVLDPDRRGRDPVGAAMIRNWCDALSEANPVYIDPDAAVRSGFAGLVAPPAMLRTWTMLSPTEQLRPPEEDAPQVYRLLEQQGFTGKAGTNCNHSFSRYLVPGDELTASTRLLAISGQKRTALGLGYFLDTGTTYRDATGAVVAEMMWRSLRYRPASREAPVPCSSPPVRRLAGAPSPAPAAPPAPPELAAPGRRVAAGQRLPGQRVAITPGLIIGGAMASRDYQPVHHDRDYARTQGVADFFMNMMTSAGLVSRYITDWAGPAARFHTLNLTLGAPNHPGDTMMLDASVQAVGPADGPGKVAELVTLVVTGRNSLGSHVRAEAGVSIPRAPSGGRS